MKSSKPAIIGVSPAFDSEHQRGRRRFADGRTDRRGPRRQPQPSLTTEKTNTRGKSNVPSAAYTRPSKKQPKSASMVMSSDNATADEKGDSPGSEMSEPDDREPEDQGMRKQ